MKQRGYKPMGVLMALLCAIVPGALAQSAVPVELHGFGTWSYGNSSANNYLNATERGEYEDARLALNLHAQPDARLHVSGQVEWVQSPEGTEVELDYVFAEWQVSDTLHLRAGKVKNPFGLSSEVFDVGTLRPFVALPQAVYGPAGLIGEGYLGLGLSGHMDRSSRWGVAYDVYFGGLRNTGSVFEVALLDVEAEPDEFIDNVIGGRLVFDTPVDGLSFGLSGLTGRHEHRDVRVHQVGAQAQYLQGPWSVRAEWVRHSELESKARAGYVELARRLGGHVQVAAQYGRRDVDVPEISEARRGLLEHDEWALGLNWWFTSSLVAKVSYHDVAGNLLARPPADELLDELLEGDLVRHTRALFVSVQFAF